MGQAASIGRRGGGLATIKRVEAEENGDERRAEEEEQQQNDTTKENIAVVRR